MCRAIAWPVRREQDAIISAVQRRNIVVSGGLVGHFCDHRRLAFNEARHFIHLPIISSHLILRRRCADDHAEHRLRTAPMHGRLAHSDGVGKLHAVHAETGFAGEVAHNTIGVTDHQIAAAHDRIHAGAMIAKGRCATGEIVHRWYLRDEHDRAGQNPANTSQCRPGARF